MTSNRFLAYRAMHLRLPAWRIACGHRRAARALPFDQFQQVEESQRCLKCNARNHLLLARQDRQRQRDAAFADGTIPVTETAKKAGAA